MDFPGSLKVEKSRIRTYEDSRPRIYNQLQLTTLAPSQFLPLEIVFFDLYMMNLVILTLFNTSDSSIFYMLLCVLSFVLYHHVCMKGVKTIKTMKTEKTVQHEKC